MRVDSPSRSDQQQARVPAGRQPGPNRQRSPRPDVASAATVVADPNAATTEQPAEIVAIRQRHDRTHLIVAIGESRYHVTVAVARDHSTGRAIGFRHWIRSERVTLGEQESIDAALRDIELLERAMDSPQDPTMPADLRTIDAASAHTEVVEERRQPGTQW